MTEQRIRDWYEYWEGNIYISRSGGKDSDVLGDIVRKMYPDVPQVFVNTGLEFESVRLHAMEECDTILKPEMNFYQVLTKYGYPVINKDVAKTIEDARSSNRSEKSYAMQQLNGTYKNKHGEKSLYCKEKWEFLLDAPFRISNKCCNVMKKKPAKKYALEADRKPVIGTMAGESRQRKRQWIKNGCNGFHMKTPVSNPISFWTEQDILLYILENNLRIAEAYGTIGYMDNDGMLYESRLFDEQMQLITTKNKRTGCIFCMFGITQDTHRFLKLKELEPQKYDYVMRGGKFDGEGMWIPDKGLGFKFVIDWLNEHGNLKIRY